MNDSLAAPGSAIASRLDRLPLTFLHATAIGLCAAGFMFDLLEISLGSVLSAVFSTAPNIVPAHQLSLLLSAVYVGAIVGAPALGWWADRHGRRQTLMGMQIWLALMSLGAALSTDVGSLTVFRVLAGIALGAYPPLVIAFLTDILPPGRRGMMIFVTVGIASLGPVVGVFFIRALASSQPLGLEPWRWGFLLGGVGAAVCGCLMRALPESPRWLQAKGRDALADAACRRFESSGVILRPRACRSASPCRARPRSWRRLANRFGRPKAMAADRRALPAEPVVHRRVSAAGGCAACAEGRQAHRRIALRRLVQLWPVGRRLCLRGLRGPP